MIVKSAKWRCPSNIAIVKYWGKKPIQIPCNSSLSMTLSDAFTELEVELLDEKSSDEIELDYYFEGKLSPEFGARVVKYLKSIENSFEFLKQYKIVMRSTNSFPHSAGIASSASAFGAIALGLNDLKYQFENKEIDSAFYSEASNFARLGSGSASRSLFKNYALWGKNEAVEKSSDTEAFEIEAVHPVFQNLKDAILIVEDEPKKVSSSVGHSLMNNHSYSESRFKQANLRVSELVSILESGKFSDFIQMCESEALTLHAMMMTSEEYYLLVKPQTISIIDKILDFRNKTGLNLCFTLDAGPNIHLIYQGEQQSEIELFIKNELSVECKSILFDKIGGGPLKLT